MHLRVEGFKLEPCSTERKDRERQRTNLRPSRGCVSLRLEVENGILGFSSLILGQSLLEFFVLKLVVCKSYSVQ